MIRKVLSVIFVMAVIALADTTRVIMPDYFVLLQQEAIRNTKEIIKEKVASIHALFENEKGTTIFSTVIIMGERYSAFNERNVNILQAIVTLDRYMGEQVTAGYIKNSHRLAVIEILLNRFKKLS